MAETLQQTAQCGGWAENEKTSKAGSLLVSGNNADVRLLGENQNPGRIMRLLWDDKKE